MLGASLFTSVVRHAGRVGPRLSLDNIHATTLGPQGQLLHGRGAKGIASRHQNLLPLLIEKVGQFGDRGSLA